MDLRGTGLTSLSICGTTDLLHLADDLMFLHLLDGALRSWPTYRGWPASP